MRSARALAVLALVSLARPASAASALAQVAQEVAKGLGAIPAGSLVVASPLTSDVPLTKGDEISLRVANVVAGKLPGNARAHGQALALSLAHAAAKGKPAVVFLKLEIARGELRVTADAFVVVANGWDRIRLPPPAPVGHAYASAPIDAEVRSVMPPIPLEQAHVTRAKQEEGDVLAVACGDVDGDGSTEIVTVTRERIAVGRLRAGKLVVERSASWTQVAPRAPITLREPLAGVVIVRGQGVLVGTTERVPFALDASLAPREPLHGIPIGADGCANVDASASAYGGPLAACTGPILSLPMIAEAPKRWDAGGFARVVATTGQEVSVIATRDPGGKLTVRMGPLTRGLDGAGAQVAVGDLDLDGAPDLVSSSSGAEDALSVHSLIGGELKQRLRVPAPQGVRAVCICPPEERALPAVVAVVGDEVWLVR
jgi:hypothetical protein